MNTTTHIHLPLLGDLYVEFDTVGTFRGRILDAYRYHGEYFLRVACFNAIFTPRGWKYEDHNHGTGTHPSRNRAA